MPTIKAAVIKNTSKVDLLPEVYAANPNSLCNLSNLSNKYTPFSSKPPKPNCGIGFPVIWMEIKIAGTINAKISTQYCAT